MPAPTEQTLLAFDKWLERRGRADSTRSLYRRTVKHLYTFDDPLTPLVDRQNAGSYRNALAVALRSWAKFSGDKELQEALAEVKLPHSKPKTPREPLEKDDWFTVLDTIEADSKLPERVRAVLLIIGIRGLRCSDALRIRKVELRDALRTGTLSFLGKGERQLVYSAGELTAPLKTLLAMPGDDNTPVWRGLTSGKKESAARAIRYHLQRFAKRLGRAKGELYAHRFRHSYVNAFLNEMQGDPRAPFLLQDQMDWASPATARNYVKRGERGELAAIEGRMFTGRRKGG